MQIFTILQAYLVAYAVYIHCYLLLVYWTGDIYVNKKDDKWEEANTFLKSFLQKKLCLAQI